MKKFYLLAHDSDPKLASIIDYDLFDYDDSSLIVGDGLNSPLPKNLKLVLESPKKWVDYINNPLSWRIFSRKFKDTISPYLREKDFFQEIVLDSNSETVKVWLGVFRTSIDCMDKEESIFRERPKGVISSVSKLVVASEKVPDYVHLFLLKSFPFLLVFDDVVKEAVDSASLCGYSFIECEST